MIWYMIWYMNWYDIWIDVIWYDMIYDIWYDMIWYDIWYDMTWHDMTRHAIISYLSHHITSHHITSHRITSHHNILHNISYTTWCRYKVVNFLQNPHKRHPIALPLWWGMGFCEFNLWISSGSVAAVMYIIQLILGHVIMALNSIWHDKIGHYKMRYGIIDNMYSFL